MDKNYIIIILVLFFMTFQPLLKKPEFPARKPTLAYGIYIYTHTLVIGGDAEYSIEGDRIDCR